MTSYIRQFFGTPAAMGHPISDISDGSRRKWHGYSSSVANPALLPVSARDVQFIPVTGSAITGSSRSSSRHPRSKSRSGYVAGSSANVPSLLRYESSNSHHGACRAEVIYAPPQQLHQQPVGLVSYNYGSKQSVNIATIPGPMYISSAAFSSAPSSSTTISSGCPSTSAGSTRPAPSRTSSSASVPLSTTPSDTKSAMKKHGERKGSHSGPKPHVSFLNPNKIPGLHMHPLFASSRLHHAPISYDVVYPPSTIAIVDRSTRSPIPMHTLTQPATDPPTYTELILTSDKFPWKVVVLPGSAPWLGARGLGDTEHAGPGPGPGVHGGGGPYHQSRPPLPPGDEPGPPKRPALPPRQNSAGSAAPVPITNLDVMYAVNAALAARVTQTEWAALGQGGRAQRKATRAYQRRCTRAGGALTDGVHRVDYLGSKTTLVGIDVDRSVDAAGRGKLVFSRS